MTDKLEILSWGKKIKLARNESTSADVLTELSRESSRSLRKLIAGNPNTPVEVLEYLGQDYVEEIISNPIFDILLLENPNSKFLKICLACSSNTSIEILEKLSCDDDYTIRAKVAENNTIDDSLLAKLAKDENYYVIESVLKNKNVFLNTLKILTNNFVAKGFFSHKIIKHPKSTTEIIYLLIEGLERKDLRGRYVIVIAQYRKTPVDILRKLVNSNITSVRRGVAENRNTPLDLLNKLSNDNAISVIKSVARNPKTPGELLARLSCHPNKSVRSAVAYNYKTPAEVLTRLSEDDEESVVSAVAGNLNTSVDVLIRLANSSSQEVCVSLAQNFNTPRTILEQLYKDSPGYIYAIVRNHKIVAESLIELAFRRRNTENNKPKALLNELDSEEIIKKFEEYRCYYPTLKASLVVIIVDLLPNSIRSQIVSNPNLSKNMLEDLSNYWSQHVRKLVARNPSTSSKTLAKLAQDPVESVRKSVIKNKNTPSQSLIALTENVKHYCLRKAVNEGDIHDLDVLYSCLEKLANSSDWLDRKSAAKHKDLPLTILERLLYDKCKYVRAEVANNENSSSKILKRLEKDLKNIY